MDHLLRRLDLGRHVGELVADDLELADRAAERLALLRVLERALEHPLARPRSSRRRRPAALPGAPRRCGRSPCRSRRARRRPGPACPRTRARRCRRRACPSSPACARSRSRARCCRPRRAGRRGSSVIPSWRLSGSVFVTRTQKSARAPLVMNVFGAVDHVLVAVADRGRADPGDVGAGARLGDPEGADPLALDPGDEVALLLLLGAEQVDRRQDHVGLDREAHVGPARARVAHALGADQRVEVVAALSAVLLREAEAEVAELAGAAHDLVRPQRLLPLVAVGVHLLLHPGAHRLAQVEVLVGEHEVLARAARARA